MILPLLLAGSALLGLVLISQKKAAPALGASTESSGGPKVPDAFTDLATNALQIGDTTKAEQLAKEAEARGLNTVATNIRAEVAQSTGDPQVSTTTAPNAPKAQPLSGRPLLRLGSTGADVIEWQHIIGVKPDGVFGAATRATTIAWQLSHRLTADGIVGPRSWAVAYAAVPALARTPMAPAIAPVKSSVIYKEIAGVQPTLRRGSSGEPVRQWQTILVASGNPVTVDGQFGVTTEGATKTFQTAHGLKADGIVGPQTWAAGAARVTAAAAVIKASAPAAYVPPTHATIRRGSTGPDVKAWQAFLQVKQDGQFGSATEYNTKVWQASHALTPDGIVGPKTWAAANI